MKHYLPHHESEKWREGHVWKGVFIQVFPIVEADHVMQEIKAQGEAQIELMQMNSAEMPPQLAKQIVVPLIAAVKCGCFLLYATPQIYCSSTATTRSSEHVKANQGESELPPRVASLTILDQNASLQQQPDFLNLYRSIENPLSNIN